MNTKELNKFIDHKKYEEECCDYILNYYKKELGHYPGPTFLKQEIKRLSKHLFKSKEHYKKIKQAKTTLQRIGYNCYIETM